MRNIRSLFFWTVYGRCPILWHMSVFMTFLFLLITSKSAADMKYWPNYMFTVFWLTYEYISCICIFRQASVNGYYSPSTQLIVLLYYIILCYVMLYYIILCYVVLCYVMLSYVTLRYVMLYYIILYYIILYYIILHYIILCNCVAIYFDQLYLCWWWIVTTICRAQRVV